MYALVESDTMTLKILVDVYANVLTTGNVRIKPRVKSLQTNQMIEP